MRKVLLAIGVSLYAVIANPLLAQEIDVAAIRQNVPIQRYVQVLTLAHKSELAEARRGGQPWKKPGEKARGFPIGVGDVWVSFTVKNSTRKKGQWMLECYPATIDYVDAYIVRPGGVEEFVAGDRLPARQWKVYNRSPAFPVDLAGGESAEVYVRLRVSAPFDASLELMDSEAFSRKAIRESVIFGLYFGGLFFLFVLSSVLYFLQRWRTFLFYSLYVATVGFLQAARCGLVAELAPWGGTWLANEGLVISGMIAMALSAAYSREFLNTRKNMPRVDLAFRILIAAILCAPVLFALEQETMLIALGRGSVPCLASLLLIAAVIAIRRKIYQAKFFCIGWGSFFAFTLAQIASSLGILPVGFLLRYGLMMGILVEATIFSLALALRVRESISFASKQRAELASYQKEMELVRVAQNRIFPAKVPRLSGLTIETRYLPYSAVGGDFYSYHILGEERIGILIADVAGHGLPAALDATMVHSAFVGAERHAAAPDKLLDSMNRYLVPLVEYRFVSADYVVLDMAKKQIISATAGHPAPLILRGNQVQSLDSMGYLLGFRAEIEFPTHTSVLQPGDRLILYTDGIYEWAKGQANEMGYDVFLKTIARCSTFTGQLFIDNLLSQMNLHGQPEDDVTLLVVDIESKVSKV
ncbi:SpoIIE family protein phosphatase [Leptospira alstonii]|uniref:SpoIIE family protein phosphatase n=1 Tax=Leptospira alstonii TaxID=28452 RepID=UPI001E3F582C|nr:SpoIIE family protein phosphatase [Leptospira alstonii]